MERLSLRVMPLHTMVNSVHVHVLTDYNWRAGESQTSRTAGHNFSMYPPRMLSHTVMLCVSSNFPLCHEKSGFMLVMDSERSLPTAERSKLSNHYRQQYNSAIA